MCFFLKDKWQSFIPTKEYLDVVNNLDTITKLHNYMKLNLKYVSDIKDYWQTPEETLIRGAGDCEDMARFAIDVLVRIQKMDEVRFICYTGYYLKDLKKTKGGHAVCVFPYNGKYAFFSNNSLLYNFDNSVDIGHESYPLGLKRMAIRNWQGQMIDLKVRYFGTF